MSELKPCPFCGAKPHKGLSKIKHDQLHGDAYQDTTLKCPHLCATMEHGEEIVTERWNTRPGEDAAWNAALNTALMEASGVLGQAGEHHLAQMVCDAIRSMKKP